MFDDCLFFNLAALHRQLSRIWQRDFQRLGLSASHAYLLAAVADAPGATQKELSDLLLFDASTIARFVEDLVGKGLVSRQRAGREVQLSVTAAGAASAREIREVMDRLFASMQTKLGRASFTALVERLCETRAALQEDPA